MLLKIKNISNIYFFIYFVFYFLELVKQTEEPDEPVNSDVQQQQFSSSNTHYLVNCANSSNQVYFI